MAEYLKRAPVTQEETADDVKRTVETMLQRIEKEGLEAIRHYSDSLDGWNPDSFRVSEETIAAASEKLSPELKAHIDFALAQVRRFAEAQLETISDLAVETQPGVLLGHRNLPVESVGAYVPGGRYPMLASAFMTVAVPKVAGVSRVVTASPPWKSEGIHPAMLYSMASSGADEILCLGGVQGLAMMALGAEDFEPVDMIVGAGNQYVAEAKRQLFGKVGIDLLAGPTEILVIADENADDELVAADLLGQAEHGPNSPAILITTSAEFGRKVLGQIDRLLVNWPTAAVAREAWKNHGNVVVVADRDEAIELSDQFAPEHLEVQVAEDELEYYLSELNSYGSLFLGDEATVNYGDKAVGTNHVLPTNRAARYTGGLWVGKFLRTVTYQRLTPDGTRRIAPAAAAIASAEMLQGHAITSQMRLDRLGTPVAG